jgi:WD40 repeat protein
MDDGLAAPRHRGFVTGLAVSLDRMRALSAGADGTVRLWDLADHELLRRIDCAPAVGPVAYSDDGTRFFVATTSGIRVFDADGTRVATDAPDAPWLVASIASRTSALADAVRTQGGRLDSVAFTPGGERALVATPDLELWDAKKLTRIRRYENCPPVLGAVGVSPDGTRGVALHSDRKLRLWSLDATWAIAATSVDGVGVPSVITFAPSGRWFLAGTTDGRFLRFALPK